MRSAFLFMCDDRERVSAVLDDLAIRIDGYWIVGELEWPTLRISVDTSFDDFEIENVESAAARLGEMPAALVVVDVSGRIDGRAEVTQLACDVLSRLRGVAQDDHTTYSWSLAEIQEGEPVDGHLFFVG